MLTGFNKILAAKVAQSFCEGNELCQISLTQRLDNLLSDSLFKDVILPGLQTHRFYVLTEWKVTAGNFGKININYKVQDIFTGSVHSGYIGDYAVSQGVSTIKQIFEKYIKEPYRVISETSNGIILKRSVPGGYNIITPTITITPGSSSPTIQPGGSVVTPSGQIQPAGETVTSNFLSKAVLAVGAFLLFKGF